LYKVDVNFTLNAVLEIDATNQHEANEEVGRLETSVLDEVNNWGMCEIRELRMCAKMHPAEEHP
jgi:hypothetical protein